MGNILTHGDRHPTSEHPPDPPSDVNLGSFDQVFKGEITEICETCRKIDLTEHKGGARCYALGSLLDVQARESRCQLCRAWLQLLPKVESPADHGYGDKGSFELASRDLSHWKSIGVCEAWDIDGDELADIMLFIRDRLTGVIGADFMITASNRFFLPGIAYAQWNEISPQVDFSLPLSWMKFCRENHEICNAEHGPQKENISSVLRLIDCEQTMSSGELHVIRPKTLPQYAALSYVWGKELVGDSGSQTQLGFYTGSQIIS
jgi:hypothetical protein